MELSVTDWIGSWENFELWTDSDDPELVTAWREVEEAVATMPPQVKAMFGDDPRSFWRMACQTATPESPVRLGGWRIAEAGTGGTGDGESGEAPVLEIEWRAEDGAPLGRGRYELDRVVERGLEGKPNLLLHGEGEGLPAAFAWLLAMEPMPARDERERGGLLAHTHFQFASEAGRLITSEGRLANPRWYATMVDAARTNAERVRIIRALHHLG